MRVFLLLIALALDAAAAGTPMPAAAPAAATPAATPPAATPAAAMAQIAGVYKHRFQNGIITPGKAPMEADTPYESEDIVEIVPYDATHLYFRAELQFYNGHSCSISGMAGAEGKAFVYHDPTPTGADASCTLTVTPQAGGVALSDRATPEAASSCSMYCGARGSLTQSFPNAQKRPIRYLALLQNSVQYRKAVAEMRARDSAPAKPGLAR